jgi:hypothetical protein
MTTKPKRPEPAGSSTERSRKHRALNPKPPEVRGIRAPAEHHTAIRQAARDLAQQLQSPKGKE